MAEREWIDSALDRYENAVWALARAEFRGDDDDGNPVDDALREVLRNEVSTARERLAQYLDRST